MLSWTADFWEENKEICQQQLSNYDNCQRLPCFNCTPLYELKDGQLVRYRGMVQDTLNPEYFLGRYEVMDVNTGQSSIHSGRYRDLVINEETERVLTDSVHLVNEERQTMYVISIPALNLWAIQAKLKCCTLGQDSPIGSHTRKRKAADGDEEMICDSDPDQVGASKRCRSTEATGEGSREEPSWSQPDHEGKTCLVKLYNGAKLPAVNEVIDIIGFLSINLLPTSLEEGEGDPPPSVPRLHAVQLNPITHYNPLLPPILPVLPIGEAETMRQNLHHTLTQVLFGDELAANYLICHLISRVYLRNDTLALGHLSLNLCLDHEMPDYALKLYSLLTDLLPTSKYISLSPELLQLHHFAPRKDYDKNRLESGFLQLAKHTHLLVDETALAPVTFNDTGTRNLITLSNVLREQVMEYDFVFYRLTFPTDLPVLIISEKKALMPCAVTVTLKPQVPLDRVAMFGTIEAVMLYLEGSVGDDIRKFLTVAMLLDYSISKDNQKVVQEDFVNLRKENRKMSDEDLHVLLVLARWLSLSHGRTDLTIEMWKEALNMERQRKERFLPENRMQGTGSVNQ